MRWLPGQGRVLSGVWGAMIPACHCRCGRKAPALLHLCPWQLFALCWQHRAGGVQAGAFLPARHQETLLHVPCLGRQLLGQCWSQFIVCDISWQCLLCKVPVVLLALGKPDIPQLWELGLGFNHSWPNKLARQCTRKALPMGLAAYRQGKQRRRQAGGWAVPSCT